MDKNSKITIVMWYGYSRRASSLSKELNAELILINTHITKSIKLRKYLLWYDYFIKSIITTYKLINIKPDIVIATSPPSFCPIICFFYTKLFSKKLYIDAHNSAFVSPWINVPLYSLSLINSEKILVHNLELFNFHLSNYQNYNFHLLPDPLPIFNRNNDTNNAHKHYIFIICSFSDDEPIDLILNSIEMINFNELNYNFLVTGDYRKRNDLFLKYKNSPNIIFLGFLPENDYVDYLLNATAVITISKKEMVQQSAAIEALSACIPIILENSLTNKRIFNKGVVFTEINAVSLRESIIRLLENQSKLKEEIAQLKEEYKLSWYKYLNNL